MPSVPPFGPGSGWGESRWGFSAGWGDGFFGQQNTQVTLVLTQVYAASRRHVFVEFNNAPLMVSGFGPNDSLNPANWIVTRTDTGERLPVGGVIPNGSLSVILYLLDPLGPPVVNHAVSVSNLRTSGGSPMTSAGANFIGIANSADNIGARPGRPVTRDLLSRPLGDGEFGATLAVGSNGDYANQQGVDLLRKLVERRLFTKPGDFKHLPDYGLGLDAKTPVPPGDLVRLKKEIEEQVLREPEFTSVTAGLILTPDGELTILLTAVTRTGLSVETTLAVQTGAVSL